MGNDHSSGRSAAAANIINECSIDDDPILKTGQWSLHHAQLRKPPTQLSVFIRSEDAKEDGPLLLLAQVVLNLNQVRQELINSYFHGGVYRM
jgi:hypothetical protein